MNKSIAMGQPLQNVDTLTYGRDGAALFNQFKDQLSGFYILKANTLPQGPMFVHSRE